MKKDKSTGIQQAINLTERNITIWNKIPVSANTFWDVQTLQAYKVMYANSYSKFIQFSTAVTYVK